MDFKTFPKIERFEKVFMRITQKIHGTNAQIFIKKYTLEELDQERLVVMNDSVDYYKHSLGMFRANDDFYYRVYAGSRTRWITPDDDNFGFAKWVDENKQELVAKLGEGQYFGEWAGPGINSGEGLTKKTFVLFDHWKFPPERPLPVDCAVVPVLYSGPLHEHMIGTVMLKLKEEGSVLAPGFMRPEGAVIEIAGVRYKKVFDAEETKWKEGSKPKTNYVKQDSLDVSHLLQPIRLEKLLSKDERLVVGYPKTLGNICSEYIKDLEDEGQLTGDEDEKKAIRKALGSPLFGFIKSTFKEKGL